MIIKSFPIRSFFVSFLLVLGQILGITAVSAQVAQEGSELLWRRSADGLLMKDNGAESEA